MCFERGYVFDGLEKKSILRTAEQVWVVMMFAHGNKWDKKPEKVRQVNEQGGLGDLIPINFVPREVLKGPVEGYVLFNARMCSLPSHKLGYNKPGLPMAKWYVNSDSKTQELIRNLDWWNGNPPVRAIPAVWSRETGTKVKGDFVAIDELRVRIGECVF